MLQGVFRVSAHAHDPCVGPVPNLLHSGLSKEIRPSWYACLSLTSPVSVGLLSEHPSSPASSPLTSQAPCPLWSPVPVSCPSLLPCNSQSCSICIPSYFSCDLSPFCPPFLVFTFVLLVQLVWFCLVCLGFFLSSSPFHISPHPRIPYFPCLARLLILFLIPVSVQVCKAISDGEQGFIVGIVGQYKV